MNKNLLITLIVVAILAVAGIAAYAVMNQRDQTSQSQTTATPTSQASPTITNGSTDADIQIDLDNTDVAEDDADLKEIENDINSL